MTGKSFIINNKVGLHARPAAMLVQTANRFRSEITIEKDGRRASAKNAFDLLSLSVERGAVVTVEVEGNDESEAMKAIEELVNNRFGEKD
ncbi:MAG: HPr family phosphocarrier protein [Candidatus Cryosericum sp.]